jgi:hypothetical protein
MLPTMVRNVVAAPRTTATLAIPPPRLANRASFVTTRPLLGRGSAQGQQRTHSQRSRHDSKVPKADAPSLQAMRLYRPVDGTMHRMKI